MDSSCLSCAMPLGGNENKKSEGKYCTYCSDEQGKLLPREQVQQGIAQWLKSWAPKQDSVDFVERANHYMKAMPAWRD